MVTMKPSTINSFNLSDVVVGSSKELEEAEKWLSQRRKSTNQLPSVAVEVSQPTISHLYLLLELPGAWESSDSSDTARFNLAKRSPHFFFYLWNEKQCASPKVYYATIRFWSSVWSWLLRAVGKTCLFLESECPYTDFISLIPPHWLEDLRLGIS